ncbi:hypothetical protein LTR53_006915 [Teratosphaeriaceae sp. CCFEE 6253]|nr:hypothetical protein LTR53_006915 [Teratosphaeriaceae sp. CCFEE 6253]
MAQSDLAGARTLGLPRLPTVTSCDKLVKAGKDIVALLSKVHGLQDQLSEALACFKGVAEAVKVLTAKVAELEQTLIVRETETADGDDDFQVVEKEELRA